MKKVLIKDLKNSEPIKDALRACRYKVGSTHEMEQEERQIIIDFIKRSYGNLYPDDISKAFDMAIEGKLNFIEIEVPLKTRFSQAFLHKVMSAYMKVQKSKKPKTTTINYRPVNDVYLVRLRDFWRQSQEHGSFVCWPGVAAFGFEVMRKLGHIKDVEIEDRDEYQELMEDFLNERHNNGAIGFTLAHPQNELLYKNHVRSRVYESFCIDRIGKGINFNDLVE